MWLAHSAALIEIQPSSYSKTWTLTPHMTCIYQLQWRSSWPIRSHLVAGSIALFSCYVSCTYLGEHAMCNPLDIYNCHFVWTGWHPYILASVCEVRKPDFAACVCTKVGINAHSDKRVIMHTEMILYRAHSNYTCMQLEFLNQRGDLYRVLYSSLILMLLWSGSKWPDQTSRGASSGLSKGGRHCLLWLHSFASSIVMLGAV